MKWKNAHSLKKSYDKRRCKDITLPTKARIVKSMVFLVVMHGCECWTIKKAEGWRIDAFELWCWKGLLRVAWTARWSNWSILKKSVLNSHWKYGCWSWSSNTLATWYKELTNWKRPWCWEKLKAKEGGAAKDEMIRQHHQLNEHELEQTLGDSEGQGSLVCCSPWGCKS